MTSKTWTTALITGASAGIGLEFARLLAGGGSNLVLVARSTRQLESIAGQLRRDHGVDVEVLVADLTNDVDLERVSARLRRDDRPVDLLINNAGAGSIGPTTELPLQREENLIRLNVIAVLRLSRVAAAAMQKRGSGTILNVASLAAWGPLPYFAVYGATKAFVLSLSLALREELRGTGVSVTALAPGFVDTDFGDKAGVRNPPLRRIYADAGRVARSGIEGAAAGRAVVLPSLSVRAVGAVATFIPPSVFARVSGVVARRLGGGLVERSADNASAAPKGPPPDQVIVLDERDERPIRG